MSKAELRRQFRLQRAALLPSVQPALQDLAQMHLPSLVPQGRRLGIYWPLAGEVDLRPLLAWLPARLALPVALPGDPAHPSDRRLCFRAWDPSAPLQPDACGIPAPSGGDLSPDQLALLLVPALAFDRRGHRLGSGGGWYDRLRADPAWRAVPALIVAPSACALAALPSDPWDVPFDGWLSERELHWLNPPGAGQGSVATA